MRLLAVALTALVGITAVPALARSDQALAYPLPDGASVSRAGVSPTGELGPRSPQPDSGPVTEVLALRVAAADLLNRDAAADTTDVLAHPGTRALALEQVWDSSVVARRALLIPTEVHDQERFVVTGWQGVQVVADRGTLTVEGRRLYQDGSRQVESGIQQFWAELVRIGSPGSAAGLDAASWRLLLVRPTQGPGGCCLPEPATDETIPPADPG